MNPVDGELALRNSPTTKSLPYGIMINSKGVPFFVEFGANKVASIDPATMVIREWTLPNAAARPRRLAIDAQDNVWYSDYARGFLGKLDPATSEVKEWASPAGPKSQPYGIAVIDGKSLVQRIGRAAEYDRDVRSSEREISDVADPVGRRSCSERQRHQGRQSGARVERREQNRAGGNPKK